ncbi:MAG: hypothetical protein WBX11_07200 [Thiobacillaceae bacterium]
MMKLKTAILLCASLTGALTCVSAASSDVFSGYTLLKQETREMQDDDFLNQGMEAVSKGAVMFSAEGKKGMSCAACHGEVGKKLNVMNLAKYPILDTKTKHILTLQQRVINMGAEQLGNDPVKYESK